MKNVFSAFVKIVLAGLAVVGTLAFLRDFLLSYHTKQKGYITCPPEENDL